MPSKVLGLAAADGEPVEEFAGGVEFTEAGAGFRIAKDAGDCPDEPKVIGGHGRRNGDGDEVRDFFAEVFDRGAEADEGHDEIFDEITPTVGEQEAAADAGATFLFSLVDGLGKGVPIEHLRVVLEQTDGFVDGGGDVGGFSVEDDVADGEGVFE